MVVYTIWVVVSLLATLVSPMRMQAEQRPTFNDPFFKATWERDDGPVFDHTTDRSWTWGKSVAPISREPYNGGERTVQYFEKARMEINDPKNPQQSNGLLVMEMISGKLQLGDKEFQQRKPAEFPIVGDLNQPTPTTYAMWWSFLKADTPMAKEFAQWLSKSYYKDSWMPVLGLPIGPAWWVDTVVGGEPKHVLVQPFERRVLSYTPSNKPAFQFEMGNVGWHYYLWRYESGQPEGGNAGQPTQTINPDGSVTAYAGDGRDRLIKANDGGTCPWSAKWRIETDGDVVAQWPGCIALKLIGTGTVKFTANPDEGYPNGQHLCWWPTTIQGSAEMSVLKRDSSWTGFQPLTDKSPGIDFPQNVGERKMEFHMSGVILIPLGGIGDIPPLW